MLLRRRTGFFSVGTDAAALRIESRGSSSMRGFACETVRARCATCCARVDITLILIFKNVAHA